MSRSWYDIQKVRSPNDKWLSGALISDKKWTKSNLEEEKKVEVGKDAQQVRQPDCADKPLAGYASVGRRGAFQMNEHHEANRRRWDAVATEWRQLRDRDGLWKRCAHEPELAFEGDALQQIRRFYPNLSDRQVCVIGSGDNYAAFALAGLGARGTSVDISERQLEVAEARSPHPIRACGRGGSRGATTRLLRSRRVDKWVLRVDLRTGSSLQGRTGGA